MFKHRHNKLKTRWVPPANSSTNQITASNATVEGDDSPPPHPNAAALPDATDVNSDRPKSTAQSGMIEGLNTDRNGASNSAGNNTAPPKTPAARNKMIPSIQIFLLRRRVRLLSRTELSLTLKNFLLLMLLLKVRTHLLLMLLRPF